MTYKVDMVKLTRLDNSKALAESATISCTRGSSKIIFITDGEDILTTKESIGDSMKTDSDTEEENGRLTTERAKMETGSTVLSSDGEMKVLSMSLRMINNI